MRGLKHVLLSLMLGSLCINCELTKQILSGKENVSSAETDGEDSFIDKRDGEIYKKVKIGKQVWMAENLRYDVPDLCTSWPRAVDSLITTNFCVNYGRLYDWTTMMAGASSSESNPSGVQGICPLGWHIPSDSEWKELEMELGMSPSDTNGAAWRGSDQGLQLKSTSDWSDNSLNSNSSGFNALPAGNCNNGSFYPPGDIADFWSSTAHSNSLAWSRRLYNSYEKVSRGANDKVNGFSCRCVKD